MKTYELLTVFKPNLDVDDVDKLIEKINADVVAFGGTIETNEKMGRKKLAYEIENFRDGFFATTKLTIPAEKIKEFNRQLRLNDSILRTMFLDVTSKVSV
ncbi:MAG: 30S ribosomal protein S6 [Candidatus Gastranaerophilales bacterium]